MPFGVPPLGTRSHPSLGTCVSFVKCDHRGYSFDHRAPGKKTLAAGKVPEARIIDQQPMSRLVSPDVHRPCGSLWLRLWGHRSFITASRLPLHVTYRV